MSTLRESVKKFIGPHNVERLNSFRNWLKVRSMYHGDQRVFRAHSSAFSLKTERQYELRIILLYHGLEKGFLHIQDFRVRFGRAKVIALLSLLREYYNHGYSTTSAVKSAISVLCYYFTLHQDKGIDISDYFTEEDFEWLQSQSPEVEAPYMIVSGDQFFAHQESNFKDFSCSRHSVRQFSEDPVTADEMRQVVELANHAPSACNRQEVFVHFVQDHETTQAILALQNGFSGLTKQIHQVIVLTASTSYTYMAAERMQFYIDGGIYLQNLLYALHYYGIGACPGHADLPLAEEKRILGYAKALPDERLIAIIPVGHLLQQNILTASSRRPSSENLLILQ